VSSAALVAEIEQDRAAERAAGGSGTAVLALSLRDFRNYAELHLQLTAAPVVLTGANGAGKTNILEALSFLSPGRGLRRARLSEVVRHHGGSRWAVHAEITAAVGPISVGTGLAEPAGADDSGERRIVRLNGEPAASANGLSEYLDVVWLTPQMDRLFVEGVSTRRRFMDRLVYGLDGGHARQVAAYERAMRERNRLLKTGGADPVWLAALESQMAEHGVAVAAARRDGLARIEAAMTLAAGPFPAARLTAQGGIEAWLVDMPALAAEERFRGLLAERRGYDREAGAAAEGPHRSDMAVWHAGKGQTAEQCSTGEQKALLIAITLANARLIRARRQMAPLMLLDEISAHLDARRREALYDELLALGGQVWLTGTDESLFAGLAGRAQFFGVADGVVAPPLIH